MTYIILLSFSLQEYFISDYRKEKAVHEKLTIFLNNSIVCYTVVCYIIYKEKHSIEDGRRE